MERSCLNLREGTVSTFGSRDWGVVRITSVWIVGVPSESNRATLNTS